MQCIYRNSVWQSFPGITVIFRLISVEELIFYTVFSRGIAAVVWFKGLYPVFSALIEKIPVRTGKILTWLLLLFMCCNAAVSSLALIRSEQRKSGEEASYQWQEIMDERFDDERLKRIYPNALDVE